MVMSIETPSGDKVLYFSIPVSRRCVLFISELMKMIIPCDVFILDLSLSIAHVCVCVCVCVGVCVVFGA